MTYKPGIRLASGRSAVQVVVVRAPSIDVELTCAGVPMVLAEGAPPVDSAASVDSSAISVVIGKRYYDEISNLEVLCTKAGTGPLAIDDRTLEMAQAKPLPSSD